MKADEAQNLLRGADGVTLGDDGYAPGKHPQPPRASGTDSVYVGRIREDLAVPGTLKSVRRHGQPSQGRGAQRGPDRGATLFLLSYRW
jgi:aspartate-semialdehyde dehydrogenase